VAIRLQYVAVHQMYRANFFQIERSPHRAADEPLNFLRVRQFFLS